MKQQMHAGNSNCLVRQMEVTVFDRTKTGLGNVFMWLFGGILVSFAAVIVLLKS